MKTLKSLAVATGLVIGGLNVSAKTMDPVQTARKETSEIKTYVIGITPDEERKILSVEQEHAKSIMIAKSTVADKVYMKTEKKLLKSRDTKIKAVLSTDQYRQYRKEERIAQYHMHHNSRWLEVYRVQS